MRRKGILVNQDYLQKLFLWSHLFEELNDDHKHNNNYLSTNF